MSRALWFALGTGAGVYGVLKARRVAYRVSPEGLADQAAAIRLGFRELVADVRDGMAEREEELLEQLGLPTGARAPEGATALPALAARSHHVRRDAP